MREVKAPSGQLHLRGVAGCSRPVYVILFSFRRVHAVREAAVRVVRLVEIYPEVVRRLLELRRI